MSSEVKKEIQLEIAHVLFCDIVGYSRLLINEQRALRDTLTQIVRETEEFQTAETDGKLIKIPTGDGMALVFHNSPEAPAECALEISRALKAHPEVPLRMGVHSGPVSGVIDVNGQASVAAAGINMAQSVMDCGDAGHILLSKRVADDLEQYPQWRSILPDLGACEVKHGVCLHLINLYTEELGNPAAPEKFQQAKEKQTTPVSVAPGAPATENAPAIPTRLEKDKPSVAVLPFNNMNGDPEQEYFSDGITEDLITDLSKVSGLFVIARNTVFTYKGKPVQVQQVGKELGVSFVLEGSVRKAGSRLRITGQLISSKDGGHVWAERYDRELTDVFAIQDEITHAIVEELKVKLLPEEKKSIGQTPTDNVEAYTYYLRGRQFLHRHSKSSYQLARRMFAKAVELDPCYARLRRHRGL